MITLLNAGVGGGDGGGDPGGGGPGGGGAGVGGGVGVGAGVGLGFVGVLEELLDVPPHATNASRSEATSNRNTMPSRSRTKCDTAAIRLLGCETAAGCRQESIKRSSRRLR